MAPGEDVPSIADRQAGRPKVPRAVRERQMLEVAERVFAERGFHAASVDAIAEGAGISKPMIYAYFGSKEGLFLACMESARQRLMESIDRAAGTEAAPEEQLWLGVVAFFRFVAENRDAWTVLFPEASSRGGPFAAESARMRAQMARLTAQLLGEAAAAEGVEPRMLGATEPLGHALVGAAESLANWWLDRPGEPVETVALRLMNFAWMGFGNLVRGDVWHPRAETRPSKAGGREQRSGDS